MLGPEEEGKISHVNNINISERVHGNYIKRSPDPENEGEEITKEVPLIKEFKERLWANKPKKKKKGGKKKKKK